MLINIDLKCPRRMLMIPIRRCGSHALRLRLNFSPEFYSPYPIHIVDFMELVSLYGDLSDDYNYFQLVIDVIGLQNATMVRWDKVALDPVSVFEAIKDRPRSIHAIIWEMLFQAGKQHNAKVVMDKSLDSVYYADEIVSLFDDILFLNVVRDPRAQVNSINRAIIYDFNTLINTLNWVKAHDRAKLLMEKYPKRVLTIRFEDFLADQEAVLHQICQFICIQFLDSMLEISHSKEARKLSALSALWQTNSSNPIQTNLNKFKKLLSLEEIEVIETLAAKHMDYYGYEKMTKANAKITEEKIVVAQKQSLFKKQQAWEQLKTDNSYDYMLRQFRNEYINNVKARLYHRKNSSLSGGQAGSKDLKNTKNHTARLPLPTARK
jgi:hypothetical protein